MRELRIDIHNLLAYITGDYEALRMIRDQLSAPVYTYKKRGRKLHKTKEFVPVYEDLGSDTVCIGIPGLRRLKGTIELLNSSCTITAKDSKKDMTNEVVKVPELPYELRSYQREAFESLVNRETGIVQLPTGSGKTEVIIALAKALHDSNPDNIVIVIEPTKVGEETILQRCSKYSVEAVPFRDIKRCTKSTALIPTTPKVMLNKIEKLKPYICDKRVNIISDECHHTSSVTWRTLIRLLDPVRCYGFSATPANKSMDEDSPSYRGMDYGDAVLDSISGPIVYVKWFKDPAISKHLNTPIVINYNIWGNEVDSSSTLNDWTVLKEMTYHKTRLEELAWIISLFNYYNLTTVTFIHEKLPARLLLDLITDEKSMCWFGSGSCFFKSGKHVVVPLEEISEMIRVGDIRNIIATTHLDEAVDVPEINVAILQEWKLPRKSVQRAGRVLRKSSAGNSFIVNVWHNHPILLYHAKSRSNALIEEYGGNSVLCKSRDELSDAVGSKFAPINSRDNMNDNLIKKEGS